MSGNCLNTNLQHLGKLVWCHCSQVKCPVCEDHFSLEQAIQLNKEGKLIIDLSRM